MTLSIDIFGSGGEPPESEAQKKYKRDYPDRTCREDAQSSGLTLTEAATNPNTGEKLRTLYKACLTFKEEQTRRFKSEPILPIMPNSQLDPQQIQVTPPPASSGPNIRLRSSGGDNVCAQISCNQ